jgi:L-ascorbate metabolism protein UlaG (beta-lactamase superfamily)
VNLVGRILTVKPGVYREVEDLEFETVPAYNLLKPFHPKGAEWVGYILRIDGKRIYIAGDTDETKEAKAVKCDIALVPIGGTYTMDAKKAAELVNTIRPEVAIPTHYGSIVGKPRNRTFKVSFQKGKRSIA